MLKTFKELPIAGFHYGTSCMISILRSNTISLIKTKEALEEGHKKTIYG